MTRMLFWVVVVVLAVWWVRRLASGSQVGRGEDAGKQPQPELPMTQMVSCAHCGVHVIAEEAVRDAQGQSYCSLAHREQGPEGAP